METSLNRFDQCIKCTVCTAYCPLLGVNPLFPGPKQAGPDGERHRLKDRFFYDENLKYCMNCKRCEVAGPAGVKIADIIHSARRRFADEVPDGPAGPSGGPPGQFHGQAPSRQGCDGPAP